MTPERRGTEAGHDRQPTAHTPARRDPVVRVPAAPARDREGLDSRGRAGQGRGSATASALVRPSRLVDRARARLATTLGSDPIAARAMDNPGRQVRAV
jgi:hypothetical protein